MEHSLKLPEPKLEFLFRAELTVGDAIRTGSSDDGELTLVPFVSGPFAGPRMGGELVACGGDWSVERSKGRLAVDAKYVWRTSDGAILSADASGFGTTYAPGGRFEERLSFKAGAAKYRWLNDVITVATGSVGPDGHKVLDVFVVR